MLGAENGRTVQLLKTPEGGLQPQSVVDSKGVIHLVYLYGDPSASDIGYVRKAPGDREFSAPIRVNGQPGSAIALGTVRGVHLALGKSDRIHVAWNGSTTAEPKGPGNSVPMLYTRLNDRKDGFEQQRNVMTTARGLDGGGTVAADSRGNVYVVWHAQGQENGKPLQGEEHRRVWMARSADDGASFQPEIPVSPTELGACGCCGMGALADETGDLYLLYRTAREIVHRDMYLLISRDHGKTFHATELQEWPIAACPMSTVSLASVSDRVLLSWETQQQVYFASIDRRTMRVGAPVAAPGTGNNRKHPAIAGQRNGQTLLVWTEGTGWKKGGSMAWQMFDQTGQALPIQGTAPGLPPWDFAAAVPVHDRFLVIS
jgi:hypothetical protein